MTNFYFVPIQMLSKWLCDNNSGDSPYSTVLFKNFKKCPQVQTVSCFSIKNGGRQFVLRALKIVSVNCQQMYIKIS